MRRQLILPIALLLFAAAPAQAKIADVVRRHFPVSDGGKLLVETDLGDLEVTSGGTGVSVEVHRTASTSSKERADKLFAKHELSFDQHGNDVTVRSRHEDHWSFFSWESGVHYHYVIRVPARYDVELHTSGGDINVSSLTGKVQLHTSGGDIKLGRINGPVTARTSGGDVEVSGATGKLDLHTSGGDVEVGDVNGSVQAKTSGGSIHVKHVTGDLVARSSGGGIVIEETTGAVDASTSGGSIKARFAAQPRADSRLSTSGGSVDVSLAGNIAADIDAHSSGGGVDTEMPITVQGKQNGSTVVGKVNGGGPRIVLRTSGGGIRLRRL